MLEESKACEQLAAHAAVNCDSLSFPALQ